MDTLFLLSGLLAASQALGFLWILLLFSLCFFGVHAVKLIRIGWEYYKKQNAPPPPDESKEEKKEEKAPAKQEPVYYIVERKRRPSPRTTYGEPKQITFK